MSTVNAELRAWHGHFTACVRARDFEGGRALFAPDCQCFGTCAEFATDWERLLQTQWIPTWSSTHSFHFLASPFEVILSNDGLLACVLTLWNRRALVRTAKPFPGADAAQPFCAGSRPNPPRGLPYIPIIPKPPMVICSLRLNWQGCLYFLAERQTLDIFRPDTTIA